MESRNLGVGQAEHRFLVLNAAGKQQDPKVTGLTR